MDKIEREQFCKNAVTLYEQVRASDPIDQDTLKPGDVIISNRGTGYTVIKNNKKTLKVKGHVYKNGKYRSSKSYPDMEDRKQTLTKNDEYDTIYYLVDRDTIAIFARFMRINRDLRKERQQELLKASYEYEKQANAELDRIVEEYHPIKECECITHDGSCWVHHHRWWIGKNAKLLRSGSQLAQHAFDKEESVRLSKLQFDIKIATNQN